MEDTVSEETVSMPKDEYEKEHERLIKVLKSPDHKDDLTEAKDQEEEVEETIGKAHHNASTRTINGKIVQVAAYDDRSNTHHGKGHPGAFLFTEEQQNRTEQVKELFPGAEYFPIVVCDDEGEYSIIDGHNRAKVAEERDHIIPYTAISKKSLEALEENGFDKMEIAWAVLMKEHEPEAAEAINQQFYGAGIEKHGQRALDALNDMEDEVAKAEPTEAQLRAGNYPKAKWRIHGMRVSIENLAGSTRSGKNADGTPWSVTLPYHYGYIRGTVGADGDHLDCMVGPLHDKGTEVTIINQKNPGGKEFDEHKVMLGYPSREHALSAFMQGRDDDPNLVMGEAITVPVSTFKEWLDNGAFRKKVILKAERSDVGPVEEEFSKAEKQAHIKAHYRHINGKVVYVQDYDKTTHGDHPEATIHQRTVYGVHKEGTHTLRATDGEDREAIKKAAEKAGVQIHHIKRSGANHHGRVGAYDVVHFSTEHEAKQVHDMLGTNDELEAKLDAPSPKADTGPGHGPDKGPSRSESEERVRGSKIDEVESLIDTFISDTRKGTSVKELSVAYNHMEMIKSKIASLAVNDVVSMKWVAEQEKAIINAYGDGLRNDHAEGADAMADGVGAFATNCMFAGVSSETKLTAVKKLAQMFKYNKMLAGNIENGTPEASDPTMVGQAYHMANNLPDDAEFSAIYGAGKPKMGKGPDISSDQIVAVAKEPATKSMVAIIEATDSVLTTYANAVAKSIKDIGYSEPSIHSFAISATKKKLAMVEGMQANSDAEFLKGKLDYLKSKQAESQKFADYVGIDGDALMAGNPKDVTAHKMAAVSFHWKAKAAMMKGQIAEADKLTNKAKAAAAIALTHGQ